MWGHSHPPIDPCSRPCRLQNKESTWKHPEYTPHSSPIRVLSMGFYVFLGLTHRYMGSILLAQICICSRLFHSHTVSNVLLQWARIKLSSINTLRPRQNGRHFADDIFKCIFLNENVLISSKISLRFVPKGPINNIPAWTAPSHYLNQWWLIYRRIYASLGLNELTLSSVSPRIITRQRNVIV